MTAVAVLQNVRCGVAIGEGTFATVYDGLMASGQQVAVKVVTDTRQRSRFAIKHEIKVLGMLSHHSNIVRLLGVCHVTSDNDLAVVFERIANVPLYKGVALLSCYNEAVIRAITEQLLNALAYMHSKGVVHRDISADNILWTTDPEGAVFDPSSTLVKIIDFNLAEILADDDECCFGSPLGDPLYMSPEAMLDRSVISPATDVWSMGVVLFNLMVGYPPFWNDNYMYLIQTIKEANYVIVGQHWTKVHPTARTIIKKMLCWHPKERARANDLLAMRWFRTDATHVPDRRDWRATQLRLELFRPFHQRKHRRIDHVNDAKPKAFTPLQDFENLIQKLLHEEEKS